MTADVQPPLVSVIVINYNTPELVEQCVVSVRRHLLLPHEIIVVESGTIRPLALSTAEKLGIIHVSTTSRRGFGQANNLGAALARGRYLWLLNSDTIIPDARVEKLFTLLDAHPEIGLLSPVLYRDAELRERQPDFYANFQRLPAMLMRRPRTEIDWGADAILPLIRVDVLVAAAVVMRAELFRKLGGFDEQFFLYMEDDDLCYRARSAGFTSVIANDIAVVHLQGRSIAKSRERKRYYYKSQNLYWEKHHGWWAAALMRVLRLPIRLLKG
jgi:GT2 family glycosyltransferase